MEMYCISQIFSQNSEFLFHDFSQGVRDFRSVEPLVFFPYTCSYIPKARKM